MRKKSQIQTQIFVYVIAIVVLGMILVFGYKAIRNFGGKSEEIEQIQFKTDMEGTFKQIRTSPGQVQNKEVRIPTKFDEVCLVDLDHADLQGTVGETFHNPLLAAGVEEKKNIFLIKGLDVEGYNVGKITVDAEPTTPAYPGSYDKQQNNLGFESNQQEDLNDGYILCFKARQGKAKIRLKGMGDHVFVTQ